ncbi:MAG TPA: hypothetical protein VHE55_07700 [Fimbriimonadaceae bacterium]|nr:hypothetical protein [Fimbriimonadaceae bacterium]
MKKRKAPILLVSLLVVLIGGAVVFGMSSGAGDAPKQPSDSSDQITKEHDAPSATEVQAQIAKNAPSKESPMKTPPKLLEKENEMKGPTISVPTQDVHYQKPTPNGPTTSSQWYYH